MKNARKILAGAERLLRDRSGNMLLVVATAVVPMILIAGSGIDISRLYLAKSRLQAACDSGVLAGRRAMTTITYTTAIAFGTSVTGNLQSCADSGRAMQANNTTELLNSFTRIANEVADLRLVE